MVRETGNRRKKTHPAANRLIVLDDEPEIGEFIRNVAERLGFEVELPGSADAFLAAAQELNPDLIILDLQMPGVDGVQLLRRLAACKIDCDIALISGADRKVLETARRLGENLGIAIVQVMQKPIMLDQLLPLLREHQRKAPLITPLEIARALKERELRLFYQPKVDLQHDGAMRILGVEALVRWPHPRHGLLLPKAFIPVAEADNLILPLTDYVVDGVFKRIRRWAHMGFEVPVAVNLPARFFDDPELPDRLEALAREHGVRPAQVTLEATESSAMANVAQSMEVFTRLRLKGFPLAIDDFGTGFSSFSKLQQMPFSELKIDVEFVRELARNRDSLSIVKSIIALSKSMELKVCAEGVEEAAAVTILRDLGCDYGQGFYFGKAVPSGEAIAQIRAARDGPAGGSRLDPPAGKSSEAPPTDGQGSLDLAQLAVFRGDGGPICVPVN